MIKKNTFEKFFEVNQSFKNHKIKITYLELFLSNLIFKNTNVLKNRYLHIKFDEKVHIGNKKVDIDDKKVDIRSLNLTSLMKKNIDSLIKNLSKNECFGRNEIIRVLNLSPSGASKLISKLLDFAVIKPVVGHGKGNIKFITTQNLNEDYNNMFKQIAIAEYNPNDEKNKKIISKCNKYTYKINSIKQNGTWLFSEDKIFN